VCCCREGSQYGNDKCLWADNVAFEVVAQRLHLCILFIDMERDKDAWPYRMLAKCAGVPQYYIVLKREGPIGHFVYISADSGTAAFTADELPDVVKSLWQEHVTPALIT
jgi:hypothetical protein